MLSLRLSQKSPSSVLVSSPEILLNTSWSLEVKRRSRGRSGDGNVPTGVTWNYVKWCEHIRAEDTKDSQHVSDTRGYPICTWCTEKAHIQKTLQSVTFCWDMYCCST